LTISLSFLEKKERKDIIPELLGGKKVNKVLYFNFPEKKKGHPNTYLSGSLGRRKYRSSSIPGKRKGERSSVDNKTRIIELGIRRAQGKKTQPSREDYAFCHRERTKEGRMRNFFITVSGGGKYSFNIPNAERKNREKGDRKAHSFQNKEKGGR